MVKPSAITAVAVTCSLGDSVTAMQARILANQPGLGYAHRFAERMQAPLGELPALRQKSESFKEAAREDQHFAVVAPLIDELDRKTGLFARYQPHEIGLMLGTSTYGIETFLQRVKPSTSATDFYRDLEPSSQPSRLLGGLGERFPIRGFNITFSNSCASAAVAIGEAHRLMPASGLKAIVAGGVDILNLATISGFDALQVLDHGLCQPFTQQANGINLAEGAGLFLLEANPAAKPLAWIKGYGTWSEAHHLTSPDPTGKGMIRAMAGALTDAGLEASDIGYINAHGTGTSANDAAEQLACRHLFGAEIRYETTKTWHGHTLAAAGAIEGALTVQILQDLKSWAAARGLSWRPGQRPCGISNSFGFGGTFVSLLFDKEGS